MRQNNQQNWPRLELLQHLEHGLCRRITTMKRTVMHKLKACPFALRSCALALTLAWLPGLALAGSVQLFEHSAASVASGGSNQAEAKDASAMFWNPAALTRLPDSNVSGALHFIEPTGKLADISSRTSSDFGGAPIAGGVGGSAGIFSPAASFYYTKALTPDTTVGFGMTAPFGNALTYEDGWAGRYFALESELLTVDLGLSVGYKATPTLSLGFGVDLQYAKATLGNAIDLSATCIAVLGAMPCASGFATPGNAAADGRVAVKQDSWEPGWNAGLLWHPSKDLRVGLAYRSKVDHELKGDASFVKPANLPATINGLAALTNGGTKTDLPLPASAALSAFYQVNENLSVTGSATWTEWSVVKELRTRFDNGAADSVIPLEWENTWRIGAGVAYKATPALTLRTGVAYDQSPTSSPSLQTLLIPDADRWVLGIGGSYALSKASSIDFGVTRYFFKNLPVENSATLSGVLSTRYPSAGINAISVQGNFRF